MCVCLSVYKGLKLNPGESFTKLEISYLQGMILQVSLNKGEIFRNIKTVPSHEQGEEIQRYLAYLFLLTFKSLFFKFSA